MSNEDAFFKTRTPHQDSMPAMSALRVGDIWYSTTSSLEKISTPDEALQMLQEIMEV